MYIVPLHLPPVTIRLTRHATRRHLWWFAIGTLAPWLLGATLMALNVFECFWLFLSRFSAIQIWQSYQVRGHVMSNVLHAERGLGWDWLSWPIALLLWGLVCGTFHGLDEQDLPIHAQWIKCGSSKKKHVGQVHGTLEAVIFEPQAVFFSLCNAQVQRRHPRVVGQAGQGLRSGIPN